jgi:hypothetical protein
MTAASQLGGTFLDDVGNPMPRLGGRVTLVIPHAGGNIKMAMQVNKSDLEVQTAENQINVYKGVYGRVITSPYLRQSAYVGSGYSYYNTTTKWFVVDEMEKDPTVGTGFVCINFVPFQSDTYRDNDVDSVVYHVKEEKVWGWVDPRALAGSPGDGASYSTGDSSI